MALSPRPELGVIFLPDTIPLDDDWLSCWIHTSRAWLRVNPLGVQTDAIQGINATRLLNALGSAGNRRRSVEMAIP
ncbi:MAG: hypothetical protein ACE37N_06210 [Pseudohongiellaceae bacterium]